MLKNRLGHGKQSNTILVSLCQRTVGERTRYASLQLTKVIVGTTKQRLEPNKGGNRLIV